MEKLDLELLTNECEKILESLPLAHYLKVDTIKVVLDKDAPTSYFNPIAFNIHISVNNIVNAIQGSGTKELAEIELEKHIRCFLYHEVSHAILTPDKLLETINRLKGKEDYKNLTTSIANILEDERIETIFANYYLLVDFKKNLRNAVKFVATPISFEHFVFNAVRFRYSPIHKAEIIAKVKEFISSTRKVNSRGNEWGLIYCMVDLVNYLKTIWEELESTKKAETPSETPEDSEEEHEEESESTTSGGEDNEEELAPTTKGSEDGESEDTIEDGEEDGAESSDSEEEVELEVNEEDLLNEDDLADGTIIGLTNEERKDLVEKAIEEIKTYAMLKGTRPMKLSDFTSNEKTKVDLLKTIIKNVGVGINETPTQFGYCGKFNAKRFMKDPQKSYKWFEKKSFSDGIDGKKAHKKVLNIWLDQSGSFAYNDRAINVVLKSLAEIEERRTDFEWRLIKLTCNVELVKEKDKRFSYSHTGNALPVSKMKKVYNEVNAARNEFNLVLFDGNANSMDFGCGSEKYDPTETYSFDALKVFDNNKTIFISEPRNAIMIESVCHNTKGIIRVSSNYAQCLAENIVKALDLLF